MSVLSTILVLDQRGQWEFSMPSPCRVSPMCSWRQQAEWDRPPLVFLHSSDFLLQAEEDFLAWKSHSWNLHPFLLPLLFLACLAGSFFLAQPFVNLSTDFKVYSKVIWIFWKMSTLYPLSYASKFSCSLSWKVYYLGLNPCRYSASVTVAHSIGCHYLDPQTPWSQRRVTTGRFRDCALICTL